MKFIFTLFILVVNTFVFSQLPSYIPKNGLVGYWPFDGNANDYSGNNNNGVVKGATLITGRTGIASTAYNFNGNDNTIEISHNTILNLDTAFSINLWVKLPASQVNNPASYVSKYSISQKSGFVFPYINEGASGFGLNITTENGNAENAAGQGQYLTSQIPNKTSWHQFTAVFSNGTYKLYVDGFMVKANSGLGNTLVNNTNNLIFGNSTGYNQFAKGGLDEVGIWNRSLTENEIIALNGCVAPIASITANTSTNICPGSSVALSANSGSNFTYQWYRNDTIIQGATSISYTANNIGYYVVIVKSGPCPTKSSPIQVSFQLPNNLPYNPFSDTVKSCINDVVLDAGAGFTKYEWGDNSINQKLTVKEPGFHKVKITYGDNCQAFDSTFVELTSKANILVKDTVLCYGNKISISTLPSIGYFRYIRMSFLTEPRDYYIIDEIEIFSKGRDLSDFKSISGGTPVLFDGVVSSASLGWTPNMGRENFPQDITIDLGGEFEIDSVRLYTRSPYTSDLTPEYLDLSKDKILWKQVHKNSNGNIQTFKNEIIGQHYQWYKNNNLITGATNSTYDVSYPGLYSVQINQGNCLTLSDPIKVDFEAPTLNEEGLFNLFPDSLLFCGDNIKLEATSDYNSFNWTFPSINSNSTAHLVGCWLFDGNFDDLTDNKNNGINSGAILSVDRKGNFNNAITFEEQANIYLPHKLNKIINEQINSEWSISFWYKNNRDGDGDNYLFCTRHDGISIGAKSMRFMGVEVLLSNLQQWNMLSFTYQNGTTNIFQNGVLKKSISVISPVPVNFYFNVPGIGKFSIDDLMIFDKALSISEIKGLYHLNGNLSFNKIIGQKSIIPKNSGDYIVEVGYGTKGCKISDTTFIELTKVDLRQNDTVLCIGDSIMLSQDVSLYSPSAKYQWFKNNDLIPNGNRLNYLVKESGSYILKVTNGLCEVISKPVKITIESPTLNNTVYNPFQDSIVSCGKDLVLDAGVGYKSYFWSDSLKTQIKTVTKSGNYSATVEYGTIGCKANDSVFVDVVKSVFNHKDTTICFENSVLLKQSNKRSSIRYIKFESYASADASQVNVYEIEAYSKGMNVALGKNTTVNSGGGGSSIVDGNGYSRWSSSRGDFGGPSKDHPHFIIVDLGSEYDFSQPTDRIVVNIDGFDHWKQSFSVLASSDNNTWFKIGGEDDKTGIFTYILGDINLLGYNYQWYKNNTPISSAIQYTYTVSESGSYTLKVTKGSCEAISSPVKITVESPTVNNTAYNPFQDTIIGCGKDVVLDAGAGYKSYLWNDSVKTQTRTISKSGLYSAFTEYGTVGCKVKDNVYVQVIPKLKISTANAKNDSLLLCDKQNPINFLYIDKDSSGNTPSFDFSVLYKDLKVFYQNFGLNNPALGIGLPGAYKLKYGNSQQTCVLESNTLVAYLANTRKPNFKDTVVCAPKIVFDAGKYDSYMWKANYNYSNVQTLEISKSDSITFTFNDRGCDVSGYFNVIIVNPILNQKAFTLCENQSASISDLNFQKGLNYTLYDQNQNIISTSSSSGFQINKTGKYYLFASIGNCNKTSDTISVIINKLPSNQLLYSRPLIVCNGNTLPIKISTTSGNKYNWSTGQNTSSISVVNAGSYSVEITDSNNCKVNSSFKISKAELPSINLCMVTTEKNKNKVIWNNAFQNFATLSKIRVYKQNSTTSQYDVIHEQGVNELSEFVDTTSEPSIKQARYRIALVDSCGNEKQSTYHNTILLTSNLGVNNTVNLLWNKYEGFEYANFEIWRSEDGVNFKFLNSVSNTSTSFIDNNPPANCFYQVRITNPNECVSSKRGAYKTVSSNVVDKTGSTMKVDENQSINITVYPNPSNGKFYIKSEYENCEAVIKDLNGKSVYKIYLINKTNEIDLSHILSEGVYLLELSNKTNNALYTTKLVVLD